MSADIVIRFQRDFRIYHDFASSEVLANDHAKEAQ